MRRLIIGLVVGAAASGAGCRDVVATAAELQAVRQAVIRTTGHTAVEARLIGTGGLSIRMINSPLMVLPPVTRQEKAREIAGVGFRAYPGRASLPAVKVVFLVRKSFLFFSTDVSSEYTFPAADLADRPAGTLERPALAWPAATAA